MKKIIYLLLLLLIFNWNCKSNTEKTEKGSSIPKTIENTIKNKLEKNLINGEKYFFYEAFFQNEETVRPEIYEDEVVEKFKKMDIELSKDTISINGHKFNYTLRSQESRKFFMRKYLYDYYTDIYNYAFNIDLRNKVNFIRLNVGDYLELELSDEKSPFKDYFMEPGVAVFINNCLFLEYKRYIICFKKEDKTKIWDKKYCELPFDFYRLDRLCQWDLREKYPLLCANEYPVFSFKDNDNLKKIIENAIKNKTPNYYFYIKTDLKDINTLVITMEPEEESYGDQFIINMKNNKIISILEDSNDNFFHSKNFVINKDLTITVYENNGLRPKEKIFGTYKINADGTFVKIK